MDSNDQVYLSLQHHWTCWKKQNDKLSLREFLSRRQQKFDSRSLVSPQTTKSTFFIQ